MRRLAVLCFLGFLGFLGFMAPALAAGPDIGLEWGPTDLNVLVVGDLASDAGLECVAVNSIATMSVYQLGSGLSLGNFPSAFAGSQTNITLRNTDGDALAEMLCLTPAGGNGTRVGLFDTTGGLHRIWNDVLTSNSVTTDRKFNHPFALSLSPRSPHRAGPQRPPPLRRHLGWAVQPRSGLQLSIPAESGTHRGNRHPLHVR